MHCSNSISDGTNILSLLSDRAQGVASLSEGCMEAMVHRRLLTDGDHKGVGEALNDTTAITTRHHIVFASATNGLSSVRELALHKEHPPVILYTTDMSATPLSWAPMATELPENVHLETLQV